MTMEDDKDKIKGNYDGKAQTLANAKHERQTHPTFELKSFNNWIKAVLIQTQSKSICKQLQRILDLKSSNNPLLHVLDIGCGRGQDISKWRLARIAYMVANDFSPKCVQAYQQRWRAARSPYRLYTVTEDFTSTDIYNKINHSFYDMVSAQFCFHYMFGSQKGLKAGLSSILSNLLVGGIFMATIPDSYVIVKKINEQGVEQPDGSKVIGNKYFSIRFDQTSFTQPYNNKYGFYLQESVGKKNQNDEIQYTNEWLIELDFFNDLLKKDYGMEIEQTMNFLEFYKKHKDQYKDLLSRFKLIYGPGQAMEHELWEIAHLYRVIICRKKSKGKEMKDFNLRDRQDSTRNKQIQPFHEDRQRGRGRQHGSYNQRGSESYSRSRDNKFRGRERSYEGR